MPEQRAGRPTSTRSYGTSVAERRSPPGDALATPARLGDRRRWIATAALVTAAPAHQIEMRARWSNHARPSTATRFRVPKSRT
jgi:hypothetical protein